MHFPRNSHRRGGRRLTALAARWPIAAVLLLAFLMAQLPAPPAAHAQQVALVSNLGKSTYFSSSFVDLDRDYAQTFTAGDNDEGYALSSVELDFTVVGTSGSPAVSLWSVSSDGRPNTKIADFASPASITTGANAFTAPAGTTLTTAESYTVVIGPWSGARVKATNANGEDSGKQPGWSIANNAWSKASGLPWSDALSATWKLKIRVNGVILQPARVTYASNLGQTEDDTGSALTYAQAFTTGSAPGGYALGIVDVKFGAIPASADISASIYSATADGAPGAEVYPLAKPATLAGPGGVRTFTAPPDAALSAGTTYFVVINPTVSISYSSTGSDTEDTAEAGWSIAHQIRTKSDGATTWDAVSSKSMLIAVQGPDTTDATLRALALEDASDNSAVTLVPGFHAATLSYTANVGNSVDEITVKPTVDQGDATFVFLDEDDAELTDADTLQDDFQAALDVGENTIKVKVTAENGLAAETYTVVVTRAVLAATDATLSDLALEDASDNSAVTLVPGFLAATVSYTVAVGNGVDEITVKPAVNQTNATFVFLDEDDAELTDADTLQDDFQVSLAEGANTIKVKVTAEDGMATQTYTVVVTRCDAVWCATLTVGSSFGGVLGIQRHQRWGSVWRAHARAVRPQLREHSGGPISLRYGQRPARFLFYRRPRQFKLHPSIG